MKKVLFLVVAASIIAAPAIANVSGTAHDLRSIDTGANDETCVYCHTPHNADTGVTLAPLWNRSTETGATAVYAGVDLEATTIAQMTTGNIDASDAPLCISCHDGDASETLVNEPNTAVTNVTANTISAAATLDIDFSDDHPIAFNYADAQGTDAGLETKANVETALGAGAVSYGGGDEMWCSSCHDVHDNANSPFLRIANAGSALCTTCHIDK